MKILKKDIMMHKNSEIYIVSSNNLRYSKNNIYVNIEDAIHACDRNNKYIIFDKLGNIIFKRT